jgi:hypothetical protein
MSHFENKNNGFLNRCTAQDKLFLLWRGTALNSNFRAVISKMALKIGFFLINF